MIYEYSLYEATSILLYINRTILKFQWLQVLTNQVYMFIPTAVYRGCIIDLQSIIENTPRKNRCGAPVRVAVTLWNTEGFL